VFGGVCYLCPGVYPHGHCVESGFAFSTGWPVLSFLQTHEPLNIGSGLSLSVVHSDTFGVLLGGEGRALPLVGPQTCLGLGLPSAPMATKNQSLWVGVVDAAAVFLVVVVVVGAVVVVVSSSGCGCGRDGICDAFRTLLVDAPFDTSQTHVEGVCSCPPLCGQPLSPF